MNENKIIIYTLIKLKNWYLVTKNQNKKQLKILGYTWRIS